MKRNIEKIKELLKSRRNKVILGLGTVAILGFVITSIVIANNNKRTELALKEEQKKIEMAKKLEETKKAEEEKKKELEEKLKKEKEEQEKKEQEEKAKKEAEEKQKEEAKIEEKNKNNSNNSNNNNNYVVPKTETKPEVKKEAPKQETKPEPKKEIKTTYTMKGNTGVYFNTRAEAVAYAKAHYEEWDYYRVGQTDERGKVEWTLAFFRK